jgi:hypothetical protein
MNEAQILCEQIRGGNSHVELLRALEGLDGKRAGRTVAGAPHTIFQILHHLIYWQDITRARLRGEAPSPPRSALLGWTAPPAPRDDAELEAALAHLAEGLHDIAAMVRTPGFDFDRVVRPETRTTAREEVHMIAGHNSYHLGQIVLLRQALGAWPPPRGGDTW